jgi:hypothetical protein
MPLKINNLQLFDHGCGEFRGSGGTANISGPHLTLVDDIEGCAGNAVSDGVQSKMSQHHGCGENHGSWVSLVSTHDVATNVTATRLEESVFLSIL